MPRKRQSVSITKIAEEAGVSVATVSRVMNRRIGVTEEVRGRIEQILRKYDFKANYPSPRAARIAVLLPYKTFDSYVRQILSGIYEYTEAHGLNISIIVQENNSRETILAQIRDLQCAGVIVSVPDTQEAEYCELLGSELPVVFMDTTVASPGAGYIDNDSYSGACEAAAYLLAQGHRRIGFLQHFKPSQNQILRYKGYRDTLEKAGIKVKDTWLARESREDVFLTRGEAGMATMGRLLEQAPEITAVMAVDDNIALGAMTAIHLQGRRIPEDISVIGFDNYPETRSCYPPLTTVDHPIEKAAARAAAAIDQAIHSPGGWTPPREVLATSLVVRASTGPAPDIKEQGEPIATATKHIRK